MRSPYLVSPDPDVLAHWQAGLGGTGAQVATLEALGQARPGIVLLDADGYPQLAPAASLSLLAALVALRPAPGNPTPPVEWLILGFPVASMCLALLNYKAERAITNLRTFLAKLEKLEDAHLTLPSYNTEPQWSSGANKARRFHDLATTLLAAGGNAIGLGAAWKIYPQRLAEANGLFYASIALALISLVVVFITPQWSYRGGEPPLAAR